MVSRIRLVFILALIALAWSQAQARDRQPAQAADSNGGYRFQPPRPPPLDGENFDDDDDAMEMGDEGYRPPPPPTPPGAGGPNGMDGNNGGGSRPYQPPLYTQSTFTSAKGFHFKVVEGEFWEKGKKRVRGAEIHVTDGASGTSSTNK